MKTNKSTIKDVCLKKTLMIVLALMLLIGIAYTIINKNVENAIGDSDLNTNNSSTINGNVEKPQQEILFVFVRVNYSEGYSLNASILDVNGEYHSLPNNFELNNNKFGDGWYDILLKARESESLRTIEESDLLKMYAFINEFDVSNDYKMKSYDYTLMDYGYHMLYEVFRNKDGDMDYKLLCTYGSDTACAESRTVREFVNWMADSEYFFIDNFRY